MLRQALSFSIGEELSGFLGDVGEQDAGHEVDQVADEEPMIGSAATRGTTAEFVEAERDGGVPTVERERGVGHVRSGQAIPFDQAVVGGTGRRIEAVHVDDQFGDDAQVLAPGGFFEHGGRGADQRTGDRAHRWDHLGCEDVDEGGSPSADVVLERFDDRGDQRFTIPEVVLHCVGVAVTGSAGDFAQRDGVDALLGEEMPSTADQRISTARAASVHASKVTH